MLSDKLLDGRLKIRHLTLVTTIADHGTLISASQALHITQPVVTRGLREVEEILGVSLFHRGPRGVTPTIYGSSFIAHARTILAQLRQAGGQIDLLTRADVGKVRVGTHLAGSNVLLPHAITSLKAEHPRLAVEVQEATPDRLYEALLAGETDMVVGRLGAAPPARLHQERLYVEPVLLVTRVGHPAQSFSNPSLSHLTEFPWIFPVEQTALRAELEEAFLHENVALPQDTVECTSMPLVRELLVSTDRIAALPSLIAKSDDRLALLGTSLRSISRSVGVTVLADVPFVPAASALLNHLRHAAADLEH
uniref:LysR substrate-binding domain-containing protein n=1 Tax=Nonomuraea bangladeshensis TaxID=404385 RepID=UPI003F4949BE